MPTSLNSLDTYMSELSSEGTWRKLYPLLRSIARKFVFSFKVSSWHGQEEGIIEDIVQELHGE